MSLISSQRHLANKIRTRVNLHPAAWSIRLQELGQSAICVKGLPWHLGSTSQIHRARRKDGARAEPEPHHHQRPPWFHPIGRRRYRPVALQIHSQGWGDGNRFPLDRWCVESHLRHGGDLDKRTVHQYQYSKYQLWFNLLMKYDFASSFRWASQE